MNRKILGAFKTSPIQAMETEANLLPAKLRLFQKNQKYAIRIAKIGQFNPIGQRIPMDFTTKFQLTGFDTNKWGQKFANWDENGKSSHKKNPSQLIRVLSSVKNIMHNETELENTSNFVKP